MTPKEPVAIAGVPLSGFVAWVPCTGPIGVGLSVCSYAGDLVLGVAVDRSLVPDSDVLLKALKDEFEAVLLSGDEEGSPPERIVEKRPLPYSPKSRLTLSPSPYSLMGRAQRSGRRHPGWRGRLLTS